MKYREEEKQDKCYLLGEKHLKKVTQNKFVQTL